ncbi:MAG: hypothetical protein AB7N80_12440 [Bdellovibrionales bacterium]
MTLESARLLQFFDLLQKTHERTKQDLENLFRAYYKIKKVSKEHDSFLTNRGTTRQDRVSELQIHELLQYQKELDPLLINNSVWQLAKQKYRNSAINDVMQGTLSEPFEQSPDILELARRHGAFNILFSYMPVFLNLAHIIFYEISKAEGYTQNGMDQALFAETMQTYTQTYRSIQEYHQRLQRSLP